MVAATRCQVLLKPQLLEQVEAYAERTEQSLSSAIRSLVKAGLEAQAEVAPAMAPEAAETLTALADAGLPVSVNQRKTSSDDAELLADLKLLKQLKALKKEGLL